MKSALRHVAARLSTVPTLFLLALSIQAGEAKPKTPPAPTKTKTKDTSKDPIKSDYVGYVPPFVGEIAQAQRYGGAFQGWLRSPKEMKLSSEQKFYTLNLIKEDERANALVLAGLQKEEAGQYREALKMYQIVIKKYPNELYRVSEYGVFVPISQYCQRRILNFPKEDLAYYRTLVDAPAREAFEQARRQYSLIGFSEVVDNFLATSYGDNALFELGNASLDTGHYLAALERFSTLRDFFPDSECKTKELDLKIAYCRKMLNFKASKSSVGNTADSTAKDKLSAQALEKLKKVVAGAKPPSYPFHSQLTSPPNLAADDYTLHRPTSDPFGLKTPVWKRTIPGSRRDHYIYSQPVVTENSVLFRHKNKIYSHSILNGKQRWVNDIGGRATWQNWHARQYPLERILVQDGMVFTPIFKIGPSLAALDEVTGQLKWAYGPMVAATPEQARMRFESAPTGGPRTVFAAYIQDNIDGETHTDSEYGVMAFDSTTGRVRWRKSLCRLTPGKFAGGFANRVRNRIRSFSSPPLYKQGTVYVNTNAGSLAALDSLSGRVKWLMRYPYWPGIHDSTRQFGGASGRREMHNQRAEEPMMWFNQQALLIGEKLYSAPVDTKFMFCLDRRSGKVIWAKPKMGPGFTHILGAARNGQIVVVTSGRGHPVQMLDPNTGKAVWASGDLPQKETSPIMKYALPGGGGIKGIYQPRRWFELAGRPFMTSDDMLYVPIWSDVSRYGFNNAINYNLIEISLKEKKITGRRRYLTGEYIAKANFYIKWAGERYKELLTLPHKNKQVLEHMKIFKETSEDKAPVNEYDAFKPFSKITFERYGVLFELKFGTREIEMVFDKDAVLKELEKQTSPEADFAKAELAFAESRYARSSTLFQRCLTRMSSEDLDFRAAVNQQLFRVPQFLARSGIRSGDKDKELTNVLGMSRTASTLSEEIETLFALSEAHERQGQYPTAARFLRSIIRTYGHHEYPISAVSASESMQLMEAAKKVIVKYEGLLKKSLYRQPMSEGMHLLTKGLPLYHSTVSPLPKELTVRAGDLAAQRLKRMQENSSGFAKQSAGEAGSKLVGRPVEEQLHRIREYPGTPSAQKILNDLFASAEKEKSDAGRKRLWQLADTARVGGLEVPDAFKQRVLAPTEVFKPVAMEKALKAREHTFVDADGAERIVLQRRGNRTIEPDLLFLGARVRKRLDNKFVLSCLNLKDGKIKWEIKRLRLRGTGQEPGFFNAFVHKDTVVVHGLYDVLAFALSDGKLRWRYRVPFDFEIKHGLLNGDLLILAGKAETVALYVPTKSDAGEVAWQVKEQGDIYLDPYFHGNRLVSVRKLPFNVTVRYRATGKLIGRLDLPDLSLFEAHPLLDNGPSALPAAHDGKRLFLTDTWYYIGIDVENLSITWKRLIDQNDVTRRPPLRFAQRGKYLAVLKQDYDQKTIYMLSSESGRVLWRTDIKDANSPRPMHSMLIDGEKIYGFEVHPGQGYYLVSRECRTGKLLFRQKVEGYGSKPSVSLFSKVFGTYLVARVQDKQDFELKVFDLAQKGKPVYTLKQKGVGTFGVPGRASATVQAGRPVLLTKNQLGF